MLTPQEQRRNCAATAQSQRAAAEALGGSGAVEGKGSLIEALRAAGATVSSGDTLDQPYFSVDGEIVNINGADVQVFEYGSAEAVEAEASLVAPDGGSVGASAMMWMAPWAGSLPGKDRGEFGNGNRCRDHKNTDKITDRFRVPLYNRRAKWSTSVLNIRHISLKYLK